MYILNQTPNRRNLNGRPYEIWTGNEDKKKNEQNENENVIENVPMQRMRYYVQEIKSYSTLLSS